MKYGLIAIFLGAGVEGETAVLIGGVVAHRGIVAPLEAAFAAGAGSFAVDQMLFWLGRRYRSHPRLLRLQHSTGFLRAKGWMEHYPIAFVFGFRFIYGIRTASPVALGMSSIRGRTFLTINLVSAFVWAALFTTLGFVFGAGIEALLGRVQRVELLLAIIVGCAVLFWLVRKILDRRKI